jgi:hypothetical protein
MSTFTDPTDPVGGGSGNSTSDIGGFFQMGDVDGIGGTPGGQYGYNPGFVQGMIDRLIASCGPHMSEFQVENLMYLMQEYGNQDIGVDAENQTSMNKYFGDVQNLWSILYSANTAQDPGVPANSPTSQFLDQLNNMAEDLDKDPFFKNNPTMLAELTGALQSIGSLVNNTSGGANTDQLWDMWQEYNGGGPNGSPTTSGATDAMDNMMRELGQVNQDVTGVSQSIGTQFQSDTNNQQSESGALNNYLQMLYKMTGVFIQNIQSSSS